MRQQEFLWTQIGKLQVVSLKKCFKRRNENRDVNGDYEKRERGKIICGLDPTEWILGSKVKVVNLGKRLGIEENRRDGKIKLKHVTAVA